jgi:hypothetical protein
MVIYQAKHVLNYNIFALFVWMIASANLFWKKSTERVFMFFLFLLRTTPLFLSFSIGACSPLSHKHASGCNSSSSRPNLLAGKHGWQGTALGPSPIHHHCFWRTISHVNEVLRCWWQLCPLASSFLLISRQTMTAVTGSPGRAENFRETGS